MRPLTLSSLRAAAVALPLVAGFSLAATASEADTWKPLLTPTELNETLDTVRVVDIRGGQTEDGTPVFQAGHIPGAVSAPYGQWRGPQDNPGKLPPTEALTDLVQRLGIEAETPVVVTHSGSDATDFGAAARVYWTLKSLGVSQIAILNGGVGAWQKAGLPLTTDATTVARSTYAPNLDDTWLAERADVEQHVANGGNGRLLDARPEPFFLGRLWHNAAHRPGTIEGAANFSHASWFNADSPLLRDADALGRIARENDLDAATTTVSFCNTGHWAATNWFVLSEVVGVEDVKLYPESMVEWSAEGLAMDNVPGRLEWLWMSARKWISG